MLNFQLLPGDKYDGRCAEIYITEKQFLIYHCSVCEEIYTTFNELLSHIINSHYKNTKEYSEFETRKSVEIINQQENNEENELAVEEFNNLKRENSHKKFVGNFKILEKMISGKGDGGNRQNISENNVFETTNEIAEQEDVPETEDSMAPLDSSKSSNQRKKQRIVVSSMLKNYAIGRTKLNPLTRFQVNPSEERKYVCGTCGFAFKERYNLRGHLLRHSNQKNFSCSICPKKFFTKVELRLHEYRHKGERPYLCNHCGMGFVISGSLTQHITKHHTLHRPFKCEQCDKTYPNFYELRDHQLVHTDERNFQCPQCLSTFKCQQTLNNHIKLHEKRTFCCEICDFGFSDKTALDTHLRKKHYCKDETYYDLLVEGRHIAEYGNEGGGDRESDTAEWSIEEGEWLWN